MFLWITLLISTPQTLQGLVNQGSTQIAFKKSILFNCYKSSTYLRYWFCSVPVPAVVTFAHRNNIFVHKSVVADFFHAQNLLGQLGKIRLKPVMGAFFWNPDALPAPEPPRCPGVCTDLCHARG